MLRCWDTRAEILMFLGSGFMSYLDYFKGLPCVLEVGGHGLETAGGGREGPLTVTCTLSHGWLLLASLELLGKYLWPRLSNKLCFLA